jgi:transposase-like protein
VANTLNEWVKRDELDNGPREGLTTSEREQLKALQREVKELRRANDILKTASAFFANAARTDRCSGTSAMLYKVRNGFKVR